MIKYRDWINEMSVAVEGDWFVKDDLGAISTFMLEKEWNILKICMV